MRGVTTVLIQVSIEAAAFFAWPGAASAHDLPVSAHPATAETVQIEALLASQPPGTASNAKFFSFVATKLIWQDRVLAICFWNGGPAQRKTVAAIADEVAALTPVKFAWGPAAQFNTCPAVGYEAYPVRVSLAPDASLLAQGDNSDDFFASIGRQLLSAPRKAGVNLPFPPDASRALYREKTLHEFCHVLGCLHEHQRGLCDDDFDAVWIKANYRLSDELYDKNFRNLSSSDAYYGLTQFGAFDGKSVMLYSIPAEAFKNKASRCYRAAPVSDLSSSDRQGLTSAYAAPDPQLRAVEDFARLAAQFEQIAIAKRAQARAFRQTNQAWTQNTPLLTPQNRIKAFQAFESFALGAEIEAKEAETAAAEYRLTPETVVRLKAFAASLRPDYGPGPDTAH